MSKCEPLQFKTIPACDWIKDNWKQISYGIATFILVLFILYRFLAHQNAEAEYDFRSASQLAAVLNNPEISSEKRESALLNLETLISKNKTLETKYDGLIGEQLLIKNEVDRALPYTKRTLNRVEGEAPLHSEYAKTSLLLTQGNAEEALKQAYFLRETLLKQASENKEAQYAGTLYAFNLIRIALLESQANNQNLENKAWDELKQMGDPLFLIKISPRDLQYLNIFIKS